jgi:glycosyl transferase family 92
MIGPILGLMRTPKYDVGICCIAKHEEPYFEEWIEYHLTIGVSRFYIYDNESSVPVSTTLKSYIDRGIVVVEPIVGAQMQMVAHRKCLAKYGAECRWIAFIDVDEFIVPKTLTGNLVEFLEPYKNHGGLALFWLVFGSNGHLEKPRGLQVDSYTKRSLKSETRNGHIKSIVQPRFVKGVPKNPHHFYYRFFKYCVNENFERVKGAIAPHTSNKIQLNHYYLRSFNEFTHKVSRGRSDGGTPRAVTDFHLVDEIANVITDESILEVKQLVKERTASAK